MVIGDPHRLSQAIRNLLSNASKFTEKGKIQLVAKVVEQGPSEIEVALTVSDTGIGMSKDALDRCYQPFSQADPSIVRSYGGTGLGLPITKQIIEGLGGSIALRSKP